MGERLIRYGSAPQDRSNPAARSATELSCPEVMVTPEGDLTFIGSLPLSEEVASFPADKQERVVSGRGTAVIVDRCTLLDAADDLSLLRILGSNGRVDFGFPMIDDPRQD